EQHRLLALLPLVDAVGGDVGEEQALVLLVPDRPLDPVEAARQLLQDGVLGDELVEGGVEAIDGADGFGLLRRVLGGRQGEDGEGQQVEETGRVHGATSPCEGRMRMSIRARAAGSRGQLTLTPPGRAAIASPPLIRPVPREDIMAAWTRALLLG